MKKIFKNIYLLVIIGIMAGSCDFFNLDLTKSPNSLTPEDANLDYFLNAMQINFAYILNDDNPQGNFFGFNHYGMEVCRMTNEFNSTYENSYDATNFNAIWGSAYENILADANVLIPQVDEQGWRYHAGMAKVIQGYVLASLIDFFGPIPFSESFDADNFNPQTDDPAQMYQDILALYDEAIADFQASADAPLPEHDMYYNGNAGRWITLAKTLKLKMHLNLRLINASGSTTAINALIADGDLIDTDLEDFVFNYSANTDNPDSRHPYFTYNYLNGANDYMSNYFMWCMYSEKSVVDPRIRYYFYRQTLTISTDINELPCANTSSPSHYPPGTVFCSVGDGYWGRDHLDNDGIPPDNGLRTIFGLYPGGGKFDADEDVQGNAADGAQGAGMEVIMMSSWVDFMLAESALTLGTTGNARDLLLSGVQKSIDRVMGYRSDLTNPDYVPDATDVSDYLTEVGTLYDAATTNEERLDVLAKEYYLALFGNGVETYNLVRRTTYPSNLQPALEASPGLFYRTFTYAANSVNLNSAIDQKTSPAIQVFWDTNPAGAIR